MSDHPIIFSAPMVRALLDGRKTQTRRVLKVHPDREPPYVAHYPQGARAVWIDEEDQVWGFPGAAGAAVGDRLYVREAHYLTDDGDEECVVYAEDQNAVKAHIANVRTMQRQYNLTEAWAKPHLKLRPSIHMPRWASRITLTVAEVRVQRLQEISEADAVAEGILRWQSKGFWDAFSWSDNEEDDILQDSALNAFRHLWCHIHGPATWTANPWVVAVSFTVQRGNIDQIGATNA
jgi:hypothetical protein